MTLLTPLLFFSALSFLFFGLSCFVSPKMKTEFRRYGLAKQRTLVGTFQVLGAVGLLAGYYWNTVLSLLAAVGLCVLMVLGFVVRLKIKDSFWQSAPAFLYAVINACIAFLLLSND